MLIGKQVAERDEYQSYEVIQVYTKRLNLYLYKYIITNYSSE